MSFVAVAIGGAALIGAGVSMSNAEDAEDAQHAALQQSGQIAQGAETRQRNDMAPWRNTGMGALQQLAQMYNIPWSTNPGYDGTPGTVNAVQGGQQTQPQLGGWAGLAQGARPVTQNGGTFSGGRPQGPAMQQGQPNFNAFTNSPDYQFALDQGIRAVDRSAAARGRLGGGGHSIDLMRFGQGLASQQFNNYTNRLANIAGLGQNATAQLGQATQNSANTMSNNAFASGDARASMYANNSAAVNGLINSGMELYGRYSNSGSTGLGSGAGYNAFGSTGGGGGAYSNPNWTPNFGNY